MRKWFIALAVVAAAYFVASPYITMYQMRSAAQDRDGEALSEHIDFPSVRQDLKDQINVMMARHVAEETDDIPFAALGGALAGMIVNPMVDALVTPAGLIEMMKGDVPEGGSGKSEDRGRSREKPFGNARGGYESWDKFVVRVPDKDGDEVVFVLRRRGIGWKLTNIRLPVGE